MDEIDVWLTLIAGLIFFVGYKISYYVWKKTTSIWKLLKPNKLKEELKEEPNTMKSQLSITEQKLPENHFEIDIDNASELTRLRAELESVRSERNALLQNLQNKNTLEERLKTDKANFQSFDYQRNNLALQSQRKLIEVSEKCPDSSKETSLNWEHSINMLARKISKCEIVANTPKSDMEVDKKRNDVCENIIRERNALVRRLETLSNERNESMKKLLVLQRELRTMKSHLDKAKQELHLAETQLHDLQTKTNNASHLTFLLHSQEDSSHRLMLEQEHLNKVTKEKEEIESKLMTIGHEIRARKTILSVGQSPNVQNSSLEQRGNQQYLSRLTKEKNSTNVQAELIESLQEHVTQKPFFKETMKVVPTHDSDMDDVSVTKDDEGKNERNRVTHEYGKFSSSEMKNFNNSQLSGDGSKQPTNLKNEADNNTKNSSSPINEQDYLIQPTNDEGNSSAQRALRTLEIIEKSMERNLKKRKLTIVSQNDTKIIPTSPREEWNTNTNRENVQEHYFMSESCNSPSIKKWKGSASVSSDKLTKKFHGDGSSNKTDKKKNTFRTEEIAARRRDQTPAKDNTNSEFSNNGTKQFSPTYNSFSTNVREGLEQIDEYTDEDEQEENDAENCNQNYIANEDNENVEEVTEEETEEEEEDVESSFDEEYQSRGEMSGNEISADSKSNTSIQLSETSSRIIIYEISREQLEGYEPNYSARSGRRPISGSLAFRNFLNDLRSQRLQMSDRDRSYVNRDI